LFLQVECVLGAADNGDTIKLHAAGVADHPALFAYHICILNKGDFHSFVNDRIALEAIFEFGIRLLSLCNLMCSEGEISSSLLWLANNLVR
jgi:hypothetical protein